MENTTKRDELISMLVQSGDLWTDDPALLESVRREAAAAVVAQQQRSRKQRQQVQRHKRTKRRWLATVAHANVAATAIAHAPRHVRVALCECHMFSPKLDGSMRSDSSK